MKLNVIPKKEVGMLTEWVNILGGSSTRVSQFMARESLTQIFTKVTNIYANELFSAGGTGLKVCSEKQYLLLGQQE